MKMAKCRNCGGAANMRKVDINVYSCCCNCGVEFRAGSEEKAVKMWETVQGGITLEDLVEFCKSHTKCKGCRSFGKTRPCSIVSVAINKDDIEKDVMEWREAQHGEYFTVL